MKAWARQEGAGLGRGRESPRRGKDTVWRGNGSERKQPAEDQGSHTGGTGVLHVERKTQKKNRSQQ